MTKSILNFLKVTITVTILLFFISLTYLLMNRAFELDADSMMLAMLLTAFTAIGGIIQGLIYYLVDKNMR